MLARFVLALGVFAALPAAAFAQVLALEWRAPRECADGAAVEALVAKRLGDHARDGAAPLSASGEIVSTPRGYSLSLRTPTGEREIEAQSCEELVQSAAVILALLIDPAAVGGDEDVHEDDDVHEHAPAQEKPAAVGGFVRVEVIGDVGLLPHVAVGPGMAAGLIWHRTTFELSASYFPPQDVSSDDDVVGDLHAWSGRLGACQALLAGPALGPCIFVEHARLVGRGSNLDPERDVDAGVWSLLMAARLAVPLGASFAYLLEVGIGLPLSGAEFKVEGLQDTVHETSAVLGRLRTGFELRF